MIHNPEPTRPKNCAQNRSSTNLRNCVVPQINPRKHGQNRQNPNKDLNNPVILLAPKESDLAVAKEGEIGGEEEHVLGVARWPSMGIAGLEQGASIGPGLLDWCLDGFVDELGDQEAKNEADALKFTAEEEVCDEAT